MEVQRKKEGGKAVILIRHVKYWRGDSDSGKDMPAGKVNYFVLIGWFSSSRL